MLNLNDFVSSVINLREYFENIDKPEICVLVGVDTGEFDACFSVAYPQAKEFKAIAEHTVCEQN